MTEYTVQAHTAPIPVEQHAAVRVHMAEIMKKVEAALVEGTLVGVVMASVRLTGEGENVRLNKWAEGTQRNTLRLTEELAVWLMQQNPEVDQEPANVD